MGYLTDEEKKEVGNKFFQWKVGKTYHFIVRKAWPEGFAKANGYLQTLTNPTTGEVIEKKWDFALMNAIEALGEAYNDNAVLAITCTNMTTSENKDTGKVYKNFDLTVKVEEGYPISAEAEAVPVDEPFKTKEIPM